MKNHSTIKKLGAAAVCLCMMFGVLTGCSDNKTTDSAETTSAAANSTDTDSAQAVLNTDWSYGQVEIGGGGFVTGVFSTCEENVYYARTDVGGAYRWDEAAQQWKSLSYWVTDEDKGLLGIDGLAVDPNDASKLYLLAGTEYFSGGKTAILISDNYGETFTVVDVTDKIKAHGNGMGRGNGERIAVDPNNGSIIFVGGRTGGVHTAGDRVDVLQNALPPLLIALPEIEVQQNGQSSLSQGQLPVDRDGRHGEQQHNGEIKF